MTFALPISIAVNSDLTSSPINPVLFGFILPSVPVNVTGISSGISPLIGFR